MGVLGLAIAEVGTAEFLWPALKVLSDADHPACSRIHLTVTRSVAAWVHGRAGISAPMHVVDEGAQLMGWPERDVSCVIRSGGTKPIDALFAKRAKKAGCRLITVIDTWYGFGARYQGEHWSGMGVPDDEIWLIDAFARQEAIEQGLPADRIQMLGHPGLEAAPIQRPAAPLQSVLLLGSPIAERLGGRPFHQSRCWDIVRQAMKIAPSCIASVLYRPHPDEQWRPSGCEVASDTESAIDRCGTVLGSFAAPMITAYLGGRTVLSIQPVQGEGMIAAPLARMGLIETVSDAEELLAALSKFPCEDGRARFAGRLAGSARRVAGRIAIAAMGDCR